MCAILDAMVTFEVFGDNKSPAGQGVHDWLDRGQSFLAMGGKLVDELPRQPLQRMEPYGNSVWQPSI